MGVTCILARVVHTLPVTCAACSRVARHGGTDTLRLLGVRISTITVRNTEYCVFIMLRELLWLPYYYAYSSELAYESRYERARC
ncbi:hypothetical protein ACQKWADRAFT_290575 [Trichoderma austrokoningii]